MNILTALRASSTRIPAVAIVCAAAFSLALSCSPRTTDAAGAAVHPEVSGTSFRLESAAIVDGGKGSSAPRNLRLLAAGSEKARVVDNDRNVLLAAPPGGTIFSMHLSPDGEQILIHYGDAKYQIVSADALDPVASLPIKPPGPHDATGFSWRFLDGDYLLGSASAPSTDTAGKTMAQVESLLPRAVLLYVYSWKTGQLSPVEVDDSLPAIFFVYNVSGWNLTLLTYDDDLVGARIVRSPAAGDPDPP